MSFGSSLNQSVTHLPRHLAALRMLEVSDDIEAIASTIGHKSCKSTETYLGRPFYVDADGNKIIKSGSVYKTSKVSIKQGVLSKLTPSQTNKLTGYNTDNCDFLQ